MKNGIIKRGSSYSYVIRVPDPKSGKTKPKWIGGFKSEQEAKLARDKARVSVGSGTYMDPSRVTIEEFLLNWIQIHSNSLKPRTAEDYSGMIYRYIIPRLGKSKLIHLRASTIQKFYGDLLKDGGQNSSPLSARTVTYVGAILKKALNYAVEVDCIIPTNVALKVPFPKGVAKKNEPFNPLQLKIFMEAAREHRLFALFRLASYSGARKGELLALKWADISFDSNELVISKNRVVVDGKPVIQESTKGGEGRRTIKLDEGTIDILKIHRRSQLEERMKAGSEWTETGFVFVTEFGLPIDYGTPTQLFAKIRLKANLPAQRFHDLRHLHATQLLRAGTPLHVVAQRLGHRDVMVTANTYAHVTPDQAENAARVFARAVE
jgi:integrase